MITVRQGHSGQRAVDVDLNPVAEADAPTASYAEYFIARVNPTLIPLTTTGRTFGPPCDGLDDSTMAQGYIILDLDLHTTIVRARFVALVSPLERYRVR
jgi:hypothetical protein